MKQIMIKQTKKTGPVQRGENESIILVLPCESPRHLNGALVGLKNNYSGSERGEREY